MPQSPNFNGIVPVQSWLEEQRLFPVIEHSISLPFPVHLHIFSGAAGASAKERAPAYAGVKQQESQAPIFNAQHPFGVCFASFTVHADVSKPLALLYLPIGFVPVALHPSFQQTNSHVFSVSTSGSATAAGAATAAPGRASRPPEPRRALGPRARSRRSPAGGAGATASCRPRASAWRTAARSTAGRTSRSGCAPLGWSASVIYSLTRASIAALC